MDLFQIKHHFNAQRLVHRIKFTISVVSRKYALNHVLETMIMQHQTKDMLKTELDNACRYVLLDLLKNYYKLVRLTSFVLINVQENSIKQLMEKIFVLQTVQFMLSKVMELKDVMKVAPIQTKCL
ncbi:Hypothetical_protein [Hexamita inflata]|uniref:Hypothetical_protein n=1 Tax=Hexamita inflata TaxID=28002 RepID=A0AA86QJ37_9EUKA|nr:Hypothetical protein HINF_LOCUS42172 [Hexamita inflata]